MPGEHDQPSWDDGLAGLDPEVEPAPDAAHRARPTALHAAIVAAGGALGTLARDGLLRAAPAAPGGFPWTLAVLNVAGAALLGVLVARVIDPRPRAVGLRLFLATGLLGGFTTYSSLVAASIVLGHQGHVATAVAALCGTAVVGVVAAYLASRRRPAVAS